MVMKNIFQNQKIIIVSGLTTKGDIVRATYTVQNVSTDISTDLSVSTTNSRQYIFNK